MDSRLAVRLQLQYPDAEAFVRGYAGNLSAAGMFIPADEPPAVGATLKFAVVLAHDNERCLLRGEGEVVWTTGAERNRTRAAPAAGSDMAEDAPPLRGFGLRFVRLDSGSRTVLAQALAYKAAQPERFFSELPDPYGSSAPYIPGGESAAAPDLLPTAADRAAPRAPAALAAAAPRPVAAPAPADEEAELQALLQPAPLAPPPVLAEAARQLDAVLRRRPV